MLNDIIQALEKRKVTIELQRAEDKKRKEVVIPLLQDVSGLLVSILKKSASTASTPEEAYTSLRASIVDLHTELLANVDEMKKSDLVWDGRAEELRQIVDDLTSLNNMSQQAEPIKSEEAPAEPAEEEVQVRARPRKIGEKPASLRQQRNQDS